MFLDLEVVSIPIYFIYRLMESGVLRADIVDKRLLFKEQAAS